MARGGTRQNACLLRRLAGDYNVIPTRADHAPDKWEGDASTGLKRTPPSGAHDPLTEAVATLAVTDDTTYTFWDYQGACGAKITASASTTTCALLAADRSISASTPTPATGKNPQTMCPSGWNWGDRW